MSLGQEISPELREWVAAQLAVGHSVPSLRASMRAAGWHDNVADVVLGEIEARAAGIAAVEEPRKKMPGPDLLGSPLYIDAGDRRVQVLQTMQHPRVIVFGDLVSDDECEALIAAARLRLARSLTVETQTGGEALNVDRTSDGMFFERGDKRVCRPVGATDRSASAMAARIRRRAADPALFAGRAISPALRLLRSRRARHPDHPASRRPACRNAGDVFAGA